MKDIDEILAEALKSITPSEEEAVIMRGVAEEARNRVRLTAKESRAKPAVVLAGSYVRGTWLSKDADIDIFLKFPPDLSRKELTDYGIEIGIKSMGPENIRLRYSEHPYVEAYLRNIRVNVVPCYDVLQGEWKSAADRTPYHTEYMVNHLTHAMKNEARLLKKFMKSINTYGSEIKTQGFSGYVCDVLILRYGSLLKTLEAAASLKEGAVLSLTEVSDANRQMFKTRLVILDPVDTTRNLAEAISPVNLSRFILMAREFLARPNIKFFSSSYGEAQPRINVHLTEDLLLVSLSHSRRSPDIIWGQLKKSSRGLGVQLIHEGFKILRSGVASDEVEQSAIIFLLESVELPQQRLKIGPKVFMREACSKFIDTNTNSADMIWIDDNATLIAAVSRKERKADKVVRKILSESLTSSGLATGLVKEIGETHRVHLGKACLKFAENKPWLKPEVVKLVTSDISLRPN